MKPKTIILGIVLLSSLLGEAFAQENSRYSYPPVADVEKQVMKEKGTLFPVGIPNTVTGRYIAYCNIKSHQIQLSLTANRFA